tara:strand:- start:2688 stop:3131 length:444 start_codon:yes stop_codon:yes gene_type:complete
MLEDALTKVGINAVDLYRQSFIDNDRVATGKTNDSVSYEVLSDSNLTTLKVTGREDISDLEDGVSAEQYASKPATMGALEQWINARGLNRTAESIDEGLRRNGWVSGNGEFGGTPGIITVPSIKIIEDAKRAVENISKDLVLREIKI